MTGKITAIESKGTYSNAQGVYNRYQVYFADGKNFQFLAKGEFKKNIGEDIDYEVTNEQYKTAKVVYNQQPTYQSKPITANKDQIIIRQTCVKASAEFHAQRGTSSIEDVIRDAEKLINFVNQ